MTVHIVYALIARNTTIIADYSEPKVEGNFRNVAEKLLLNIDRSVSPNCTAESGDYVFTAFTDQDRMTYVCLSSKETVSTIRNDFISELQQKWHATYGNEGQSFGADTKTSEFTNTFKSLFERYNSDRYKKLADAKGNILEAQIIMGQNLTLALERGEQLDIMMTKADKIKDSAVTFHRSATKVRRAMCIEKYKWYFIGAAAIVVVLFFIITIFCGGFTFKKCRK